MLIIRMKFPVSACITAKECYKSVRNKLVFARLMFIQSLFCCLCFWYPVPMILEEPMTRYFSPVEPKCYHAWLLILLLDAKQSKVGDYVLFDACLTIKDSPYRVAYSDDTELLFDIVGRFDVGSVWKRIC